MIRLETMTTKFLLTCIFITLQQLIKDTDRLTNSKIGLEIKQLPQKQTEEMIQ